LLNHEEALKELFTQIKNESGLTNKLIGTEEELAEWAKNIADASLSEKEAMLDNINALKENTKALQAEVEANQ
jgi:hypothetical protein